MVFGDDVRGELFNKIGAKKTGDTHSLLEEGKKEKEKGNHVKAKELFKQVVDLTNRKVVQLVNQKQHRSVAEELFIQALAHEQLENTQERNLILSKVVESLEAASKTALNFGEDNRGITTLALAGLVCIYYNNEAKGFQIYTEGTSIAESKPNSANLKKILYSLGYLLDALKNINISALTEAQGYISSDLKPMLNTSKLTSFTPLLDMIVNYTGDIVESRVKMPNIELTTEYPRDLLFNTPYSITISVENKGEGEATDVKLDISIPEDIELTSGNASEDLGTLAPKGKIERTISFRLMTGEGLEERREISGTLTFVDMLLNKRKQFISPIELLFRSVSKSSEYKEKLDLITQPFKENILKVSEEIPKSLIDSVNILKNDLTTHILSSIENEQFEQTEFGLDLMENFVNWGKILLIGDQAESKITTELVEKIESIQRLLTEELTAKFEEEKTSALKSLEDRLRQEFKQQRQELIQQKEQETEHKINDLKAKFDQETAKLLEDNNRTLQEEQLKHENEMKEQIQATIERLEAQFEEEKKELNEEKENEIHKQTRSLESKFKQQITQLENKLLTDTKAEIQRKNDEVENAIKELQTTHANEMEEEIAKVKEEITKKYMKQIQDHEEQMKSIEDRMTAYAIEEKESALKALENKLSHEFKDKLDNLERDLKGKHEYEIGEMKREMEAKLKEEIDERDQKIKEFQERILYLESKLNS